MAKYRAGIVGCGGRGRRHVQAYGVPSLRERGDIVACCDIIGERAAKYAEDYGLTPYADAAEMLERETLDLVHLVTGPDVRVPTMTAVSEHGIAACIVEKPIAVGVADWRKLVDLERASRTRFAVCHQFRFQETLVRCREALGSGRLGRVLFLDFTAGMNISGQGTHILDYAMSVNDDSRVAEVFGAATGAMNLSSIHPAPRGTVAGVLFENGVRGLWMNGPTSPTAGDPSTDYQHVRLAVLAEMGRILWEEFRNWEIVSPDGRRGGSHELDIQGLNDRAQAALTCSMFDWIEDASRPSGTNLDLSLHQWKAVLAMYASARRRTPVTLAEFDPPDDLFEQLNDELSAGPGKGPGKGLGDEGAAPAADVREEREPTMKKVVITGERRAELKEVPLPKPVRDWALVKIHVTPMCTEYKTFLRGGPAENLGHEAAGEVVEVAQPCKVEVGDRVVVQPQYPCGKCELCVSGEYIHCERTFSFAEFTGSGEGRATYAQYIVKPSWILSPIPDDVSYEKASLAGCALGPTFNAMHLMDVGPFDTVLVTGAGPVGLGGVVNARFRGARVIVVESFPYRVDRAKALGAAAVLDPGDEDIVKKLKEMTGGRGIDKAVDTSGAGAAHRVCIDALRRKGHFSFVGESGDPTTIRASRDMIRKGITLHGVWHYNLSLYPELMKVIQGSPVIDALASHVFPMSRVQEAFEVSASHECAKVLLKPWE